MKQLKVLILVFAVLGLLGLIVPTHGMSLIGMLLRFDKAQAVLCLAVFVVPLIMAAMAMAKPPMLRWQAGVSLAAFALGVLKFRPWQLLHGGIGFQAIALTVGVIGGVAVTIAALARGDA